MYVWRAGSGGVGVMLREGGREKGEGGGSCFYFMCVCKHY